METAMLLLGIVIGCLAGLLLTGWLFRHGGAVEPFFLRLLRQENKATARIDTRLMLHELLRKVEDLTVKTQRMDRELQELKENSLRLVQQANVDVSEKTRSFAHVYRLFQEGFTAEEIACRLQLGRGEVELLLSLERKPPWVVSAAGNLNTVKKLK
ncbi:MAG: hypothetical protein AB1796_01990 [Bacillota bacterium]